MMILLSILLISVRPCPLVLELEEMSPPPLSILPATVTSSPVMMDLVFPATKFVTSYLTVMTPQMSRHVQTFTLLDQTQNKELHHEVETIEGILP